MPFCFFPPARFCRAANARASNFTTLPKAFSAGVREDARGNARDAEFPLDETSLAALAGGACRTRISCAAAHSCSSPPWRAQISQRQVALRPVLAITLARAISSSPRAGRM